MENKKNDKREREKTIVKVPTKLTKASSVDQNTCSPLGDQVFSLTTGKILHPHDYSLAVRARTHTQK